MAPSGETNLAVKDVVTCLQFLQGVLPSFGGDDFFVRTSNVGGEVSQNFKFLEKQECTD